jgi:hypothetical protein
MTDMAMIEYRDLDGESRRCELADGQCGPSLSICRSDSGIWLMSCRPADGEPTYVQISDEDAAAFHALAARVVPAASDPPACNEADNPPPKGTMPAEPTLTPVAKMLLKWLERNRAFDSESARRQDRLRGAVGHPKGTRFRTAIADLQRRGLIETKRGVGTWLTPAGREAAARLISRR